MHRRIRVSALVSLLLCLSGLAIAQAGRIDAFTYYIPYPADMLDDQFDVANELDFRGVGVATTISISVLRDDTLIYYDHWEDGFDANDTCPTSPTTRVWGDGNTSNGSAPNAPDDILRRGDVIALQNTVPVEPRDPSRLLFDGGDRIVALGGSLAVTLAVWPETVPGDAGDVAGILFAGAWELYPTSRWSTEYVIPIGEDVVRGNGSFRVVGLNVGAVDNEEGTAIDLDLDADGAFENRVVLGQGEQFTQVTGVRAGARIQASSPVQVHIFTGNPASAYEARAYTILPRNEWSNEYLAPRSSDGDFWLYNPHGDELLVSAQTTAGTDQITIPPYRVAKYPPSGLSPATGVRFTAPDDFYGLAVLDEDDAQDWGYSLLPKAYLTTQALIGWAPGNHNDPPDGAESRVYVTAETATTLYVDYDNDGTEDDVFDVPPLAEINVPPPAPEYVLTGARFYSTDTSFMAVWGQDESAPAALPSIDVGTNIVPLRAPSIQVNCTIDCSCDVGDGTYRVTYQVLLFNDGAVEFVDVIVRDELPAGVAYVPGSVLVDGASIPDDAAGTPFPLDEDGYNVGRIPGFGKVTVTFQAQASQGGVYTSQADIPSHPLADPANHTLDLTHQACRYRVSKTLIDPPAGEVERGRVITFGLTITNTGTMTVTQLPLRDEFDPAHLTFRAASLAPDDTSTAGVLAWTDLTSALGDLAPGQPVGLALSFEVPADLPAEVTGTHNSAWSKDLLCATEAVRFGQPQFEPACQCGCDWGVEIGIHNSGEIAGDGRFSLLVEGVEKADGSFDLDVDGWYQKSYGWDDLGLSKPGEEDRHVLVRADGNEGTCQCDCPTTPPPPPPPPPPPCEPEVWFDLGCWTATLTICNPCKDAVETPVEVVIDGQGIVAETIRQEPYTPCTRTEFGWAQEAPWLADAALHTIELRTSLGTKTLPDIVCGVLFLPETGH
jgi:uncharacterized repeat protein (TIGR01451 family)